MRPPWVPLRSRWLFDGNPVLSAGYAAAHFGKSLFWQSGELLLAFFLTEAAGLAPRAMGGVLALSLLASAMSDLLIGWRLRRSLARIASACRLQLLGAVATSTALVGLFSITQLTPPARLPFALLMAVLFRMSYSLYDTPQNVLLSLATRTTQGRTRGSSVRIAVSGVASLCLALALGPLLVAHQQSAGSRGFLWMAIALAAVAIGSAVFLWWGLGRQPGPAVSHPDVLLPSLPAAPLGPSLWPLLAMFFVLQLCGPLFAKLEPYFAVHFLHSPRWGGVLVVAGALGTIVSQPLWVHWSRDRPHRAGIALASLGMLACAVLWVVIAREPLAALACAALLGVAAGGLGLALWAAFADLAARHDPVQVGVAYGLLTAVSKLALAFGVLLLGGLLAGFDYRGERSGWLPGLMAAGIASGAIGCLCLVWIWRLPSESWLEGSDAKKERDRICERHGRSGEECDVVDG